MYARVPHGMAQFVLKMEKLTKSAQMVHAYGLRSRLWLLTGYQYGQVINRVGKIADLTVINRVKVFESEPHTPPNFSGSSPPLGLSRDGEAYF